ncbi:uncharacterized protein F4822DRAFT_374042 [Hypoxylon trugodes]|uniref:uncharacterized protein n=1 Tax=Hypoxylon trugodes TaxID=326681 RepID=UPI00219290C6|nr:uncharacterized protein F4822DRAFT_374042 [Hypoxylon trugodes]KAI1384813.1 hypothetical protein F4822DRAFT_374042 [Hypoxylon trugodes]
MKKSLAPGVDGKTSSATKEGIPQVEITGLSSPPITIRWDSKDGSVTNRITLPIVASNEDSQTRFTALINDCQPASFGYKGKDILDNNYRKATKLDCSAFSTDFCPYTLGIIDTIAQVLLPNAADRESRTGVRAELYKLNFYSAPSGFFKAHVDTPRSEAQFGSLVVSLPCHHEGGQLVVRHAGHSTTYDWSTSKTKTETAQCQWAAFYSDCEHEVLELTEGHRLTLTYNLYGVPGVGQLAGNSPALDVSSLPLYQQVKAALSTPDFMRGGGLLGIGCIHAYPHTSKASQASLPGILKGADMAVYTVFRALGLKVRARTVLDDKEAIDRLYMWGEEEDIKGPKKDESLSRIGNWGPIKVTNSGGWEGDFLDDVLNEFSPQRPTVNWLTTPRGRHGDTGYVHLTYGNEAGIEAMYTHAILLVEVPDRALEVAKE